MRHSRTLFVNHGPTPPCVNMARKGDEIMEYKSPELTAPVSAINAVRDQADKNSTVQPMDSQTTYDGLAGAYQDWE